MQLSRLTDAGALTRLAHGVYALRGSMGEENLDLAAAWLGLDPGRLAHERLTDLASGAVVSHASAAALHGLGDMAADRHEFTLAARKQSRRSDVRLHRAVIDRGDITRRDGLPVTTPARTIADLLADRHDGGHVAGVLADAVRAHLVDLDDLVVRVAPYAARYGLPRRDGRALLRHLLDLGGVAELAEADQYAEIARTHNLTVGELVGLAERPQYEEMLTAVAALAVTQNAQLQPAVRDALAAADKWLAPTRDQLAAVLASLPKTPVPDIALPDLTALAGVRAAIKAATAALPPPNQEVWRRTAEMLSEQRRGLVAARDEDSVSPAAAAVAAARDDVRRKTWVARVPRAAGGPSADQASSAEND
ncbi:MAG: hypothetical protein L0I24_02785 [Pseudonocardia sp.]|nr:hypothetical protein [Pseudonocardia sp.]